MIMVSGHVPLFNNMATLVESNIKLFKANYLLENISVIL